MEVAPTLGFEPRYPKGNRFSRPAQYQIMRYRQLIDGSEAPIYKVLP